MLPNMYELIKILAHASFCSVAAFKSQTQNSLKFRIYVVMQGVKGTSGESL